MNIDIIIQRQQKLKEQLKIAASTMEYSDQIIKIRQQLIDNQKHCPHFSNKYNWTIVNNICPYCGGVIQAGDEKS